MAKDINRYNNWVASGRKSQPAKSAEQLAMEEYLRAGKEFVDGGAAVYESGSPLELEQLAAYDQLGPSAMGDITTDPKYREYEMEALRQLEEQSQKGFTAREEADLARIEQQASRANRGRQGAIQQNMQARGLAGSGLEFAMAQQSAQDAAEMEALAGLEKNAQMMERKQTAAQRLGNLGSQLQGRDFSQAAQKAQAADEIARFNTANSIQRQQANNQIGNQQSTQNWGRQNQTADRNTDSQYDFRQDKMGVQQNSAITQYNAAADARKAAEARAAARKAKTRGQAAGVLGSAGAVAGGIYGGPAGAAAGSQLGAGLGNAFFAQGGKVPGEPRFPWDTEADDTVPAMLSPGEIVVPKSMAQDPVKAATFAAETASDPLSSIQNPQVREYMRNKLAAQKEMEDAQKTQDMLSYGNIAGKLLTDFGNSQKEDVILPNRFQDLGKTHETLKAPRQEWDSGTLDAFGQQAMSRAKGKMDQASRDFDEGVKLDRYSRETAAADKALAKDKSLNDPASAESAAARDYLKTIAPGVAEKMPNFNNMTAAQLEKAAPGIWNKYKQDRDEAQKAADRASMERRTTAALNKPSAAQIKEMKEIKALEAGGAKEAKVFNDLRALRAESNMTGPVAGRLGKGLNAFGVSVSPEFDQMNARQMSMVNEYIKATTGASASEGEMKRLMAVMPDVADTDDLYENKMKALQETTEAIINERRQAAGLPPTKTKGATGSWEDQPSGSQGQKPSWAK